MKPGGEDTAPNPNYAVQVFDNTRTARASENFSAEKTKQAETEGAVQSSSEDPDERNHAILTKGATPAAADGGISWGRSGAVEATTERGDPEIPAAVEACSGFQGVASAATTNPDPSTLGRPLTPVSGSGAEKNYNASAIFENTRIG
jgi:hypothetical protein